MHLLGLDTPVISVSKPLAIDGAWLWNVEDKIGSYTHTIDANGGYKSASFTFASRKGIMDDWLEYGLGRHIEIYDPGGQKIWEGFVNRVTVNYGLYTIARGPLLGTTCNRCSLIYTPIIDDSVDPIILGEKSETVIAEDLDSQAKYGIIEKVISTGNVFNDSTNGYYADEIRDTYLAERSEPETTHSFNLGGAGGDVGVTVECAGYNDWLAVYVYNHSTIGSVQITTKIQNVLAADPNNIFSTNYDYIAFNGVLCDGPEDDNRTADAILNGVLSMGDIYDNRYLFGMYNDRVAYYNAIPTNVHYFYRLGSGASYITDEFENQVPACRIKPGYWMQISDVMVGKITPSTNLRTDPRLMFIESVTYTGPNSISFNGGKTNTLAQKLARMGLGGMS